MNGNRLSFSNFAFKLWLMPCNLIEKASLMLGLTIITLNLHNLFNLSLLLNF